MTPLSALIQKVWNMLSNPLAVVFMHPKYVLEFLLGMYTYTVDITSPVYKTCRFMVPHFKLVPRSRKHASIPTLSHMFLWHNA
jgi:hypothetical protein